MSDKHEHYSSQYRTQELVLVTSGFKYFDRKM